MEMRFLADMCVDVRVVEWLREQGHDAIHLRDEGLHRMPNAEIFKKGIKEDRVILTFDLDFAEIAALTGGEKTSVVLFRLKNTRAPNVINHLSKVIQDSMDDLEKGAVVVVEEFRHRVRYLPIGETGNNL
jgi:predicted nuclease of predicted toxin-antitoxin system